MDCCRGKHGLISNYDEEWQFTKSLPQILSLSYGISFWIVPTLSSVQSVIATELGDPSGSAFWIPIYTTGVTIAFMVCGANSDLFGRRWFIIGGNVLLFIGYIVMGSAKNNTAMIASCAVIGFGAGNAQLAAFALPELLPNKWRHIGVVLADLGIYFATIVGPIAGRYSVRHGGAWRWLAYGPAIAVAFSFAGLIAFYYPPKHPRGIPFKQALRELDYLGAILFIISITLILVGIIYTTVESSSSPRVIGTLVAGFVTLVVFGLWETFASLKQPLTPTRVFTRNKGRDLTAPFIAGFVVTMFFNSVNIIWPTQINVFYTNATSSFTKAIILTLPQGLGLATGSVLLSVLGSRIGHWRWSMIGSFTLMVLFGGLLAMGNPDRKALMIACVFLCEVAYGWAQYLNITYIQFGVDQVELGISGGLAGVARFGGASIAVAVYTTILVNTQSSSAASLIPPAVRAAGLPASSVAAFESALPLGAAALEKVPGITLAIIEAGGAAFQQSYVHGLRVMALSSIAFGVVGIIACCFCVDIGPKMNAKIEVFLENDKNADKNVYH
ncbi:fungal trichothecene efflux pump [Exophiala viscosa]|uniref:fungal trichothecene efflux pump n=1 Tax=Exophiala viscosa TaxID=2486360 RepID=UPI0021999F05|nr:fungal trichothecene efflux pump [Exophiala viscosa]